jgi:serine/threonine-protein kinase
MEAEALLEPEVAGGAVPAEARSRAMRELGHALALDPDNPSARASMIRVLTEPPDEDPKEVTAAMEAGAQTQLRVGAALGGRVMLGWFLFLPVFWWMGMRDLGVIAAVLGPIGVAVALSIRESRRPMVRASVQYVNIACTTLGIAATSRIFGPFVLVPVLAATYALSMQVHPHSAPRKVTVALCSLAMVAPILLEAAGVLPRTVTVEDGAIVIRTLGALRQGPVIALLAIAAVASTLAAAFFIAQLRDALSRTERRVQLHAWHVQRMLPEGMPLRTQTMRSIPRVRIRPPTQAGGRPRAPSDTPAQG